jgi:hypothetical protein
MANRFLTAFVVVGRQRSNVGGPHIEMFLTTRNWLAMTDKPAPTPPASRWCCRPDVTAERVGAIFAIVGATAAAKGTKVPPDHT